MEIRPIAYIRTDFKQKFGIPRQSGYAEGCIGTIVFEPEFRVREALRGLEGFSHIWLIFDFSECHKERWTPTVRPPRLGGNTRMGVFATRSPFRPNSIGLSSVRLKGIEDTNEGTVLIVEGADLMDGTPIYDIKPYIRYSDCHPDAVSGFADMTIEHVLSVDDPNNLLSIIEESKRKALINCLRLDPRPSYHEDLLEYSMEYSEYDVSFTIKGEVLTITAITPLYGDSH